VTSFPAEADISPTIESTPNPDTGARPFEVMMDFRPLTMYADAASVTPWGVVGYPPGTLVTFSVGADGVLTGVYDNGRQQPLGRVGLAVFSNPAGLSKVGANLFMSTSNSGEFTLASTPGSGGAGTLVPGTLEMSNVDLAKQFTEMIITQRGFQANSRVMTTSDEILQELTNMKR
jgi:flagellar hook protein FlgE